MESKKLDWETCLCFELGYDICHHYENWCSEMADREWWDSLSKEEQEEFSASVPPTPELRPNEEDWPF